ncbi:MAG: hypothetical protein LBC88_08555, partial [Spirochaetaceae bacterium]|nr:hypothetical protein [Spirochaetaceae bacterium]
MKLRTKLSVVTIVIVIVVLGISSVIILNRASGLQIAAAYEHAEEIAHTNAIDIEKRVGVYVQSVKVLAQVFGEYQSLAPEMRRPVFDDMMYSLMHENENFTGLWTAWLPNSLDGFDDRLGSYHTSYTRRNGPIEKMPDGFEG